MRGGNYHTRVPLPCFPVLWGRELLRLMISEINVDIRRDLLHLPCLRGHCPEVQSSISTWRGAQIHAIQCELSTIAMIQHVPGETVLSVLLILPQVKARIQTSKHPVALAMLVVHTQREGVLSRLPRSCLE